MTTAACTCNPPADITRWQHHPGCPANPRPGAWSCPICGASITGAARARRTLRRRCARNHPGTSLPAPATRQRRHR